MLQHRMLNILNAVYRPKHCVHGFLEGRGILSNASRHVRRTYVLNIDLCDFFPSINFGRVRGLFMGKPYNLPERVSTCLAQLCCFDNHLPQGAPTSPVISNMICGKMDSDLQTLAKRWRCMYTRYADDMTISTSIPHFPAEIAAIHTGQNGHTTVLGEELREIIDSNGFVVNTDKLLLQRQNWRQEVTGLTVNRFLNVRRRFIRQIRAMIHAWQRHGLEAAQQEHCTRYRANNGMPNDVSFSRVLCGKIEYLRAIKGEFDPVYRRYADKYRQLNPDYRPDEAELPDRGGSGPWDVFICHASADKREVVEPLVRALRADGISCWYDKAQIQWGGSIVEKINEGLKESKFVIAVISSEFAKRVWSRKELSSALQIEIESRIPRVLPLLVGTDSERHSLLEQFPLLADKLYLPWEGRGSLVAAELKHLLNAERDT